MTSNFRTKNCLFEMKLITTVICEPFHFLWMGEAISLICEIASVVPSSHGRSNPIAIGFNSDFMDRD